ncbi:MAG: proprotein convertase P-domain-containing protein [Saprospiraceae bacterium]
MKFLLNVIFIILLFCPYNILLGQCDTYSNTPGTFIPSNSTITDNIIVSGTAPQIIADLNVIVEIDHTFSADLEITLISPSGTSVDLFFDNCLGNDDINIEFDDEGTALVCATPTTGIYIPDNALSAFDGEPFDGTWTLSVTDDAGGDQGTLIQWCLVPSLGIMTSCEITNMTAGVQSSCDPNSNTYSQEIVIEYIDPPSFSSVDVNGQVFPITSNPHTITLTGLAANGNPVDVTATIVSDLFCTNSISSLFTAPDNCSVGGCNSPNTAINSNSTITDNIIVSGTAPQIITDLNVIVEIDHTFSADLEITLISPSGTSVDLFFDNCGGNDDINIEFDDEGTTLVCAAPTTGIYIPDNALSAFDGETLDGTWTLSVADDAGGDQGTLIEWCLIPTLVTPSSCNISSVTAGVQTPCDPSLTNYTQEIIVSYVDAPPSGTLDVNGQSFPIISSPQTVVLTGLTGDGGSVDVTAIFSDDLFCMSTVVGLFVAPTNCDPIPTDNCGSYSNSPNTIINSNSTITDDIIVTGTAPDVITDLNVVVQINHTFTADLEITLISPSGTSVDLFFDNCGGNDNINIGFDDEGATLVCAVPTTGIYIPDNALSAFDGETLDGTWTLSVADDATGDQGTLLQWCLIPTLGKCAPIGFVR